MTEPHALYSILVSMGNILTSLSKAQPREQAAFIRSWKDQLRKLEEGFVFDKGFGYSTSLECDELPFFVQVLQLQHDLSLLTQWERSGYPSRKRQKKQLPLQLMRLRWVFSDIRMIDEPTRKALKQVAQTQRPSLPVASKHLPSLFWRKIYGYTGHWEMLKTTLFTALNAEFLREPGEKPLTHRMKDEIDPSVTLDALLEKLAANLDCPIEGKLLEKTKYQARKLRLIDGAIGKGEIRQPCTLWIILLEAYHSRQEALQYNSPGEDSNWRFSRARLLGFLQEIKQNGITGAIRNDEEEAYITEMFKALLEKTLHRLPPVFLFRILTNSPIELRKRLPELWDVPRVIECIAAGFKRGEIGNMHFKDFRSYTGIQPFYRERTDIYSDFEQASHPMLCRLPQKPTDLDVAILYAYSTFLANRHLTLFDIKCANEYAIMNGQILNYLRNKLARPISDTIQPLLNKLIPLLEAETQRSSGILAIVSNIQANDYFPYCEHYFLDSTQSTRWRDDTIHQTYCLLFACAFDRDTLTPGNEDRARSRQLSQTLSWIGYLKEYEFDFLKQDDETFIWKTALLDQLSRVDFDYWQFRDDNESLCQSRSCDYSSRHFQEHRLSLLQRFQVLQLLMEEGLYLESSDIESIQEVLSSLTNRIDEKLKLNGLHDDYRLEFLKMLQLVRTIDSDLQWTQFNFLRRNIESKTKRFQKGDFSATFPRLEHFLRAIVSLPVYGHESGLPLKAVTELLGRLMKSPVSVEVNESTIRCLTHLFPETAFLTQEQNDQILEALSTYIVERFRQRATADVHPLPSSCSNASDPTLLTESSPNTLLHAHSQKIQTKRRISDPSKASNNSRCRASRRSSRFCC